MRRDHSDLVRTASLTAFNHTNRRSYSEGVPGGASPLRPFKRRRVRTDELAQLDPTFWYGQDNEDLAR